MENTAPLPSWSIYAILIAQGVTYALLVWFLGRARGKTAEGFLSGGRDIGHGMINASVVAVWVWAATLMISSWTGYQYGFIGPWWYALGATVPLPIMAYLGRRIKTVMPKATSYPEFMHHRYDGKNHVLALDDRHHRIALGHHHDHHRRGRDGPRVHRRAVLGHRRADGHHLRLLHPLRRTVGQHLRRHHHVADALRLHHDAGRSGHHQGRPVGDMGGPHGRREHQARAAAGHDRRRAQEPVGRPQLAEPRWPGLPHRQHRGQPGGRAVQPDLLVQGDRRAGPADGLQVLHDRRRVLVADPPGDGHGSGRCRSVEGAGRRRDLHLRLGVDAVHRG